jgi:hypothetical protein
VTVIKVVFFIIKRNRMLSYNLAFRSTSKGDKGMKGTKESEREGARNKDTKEIIPR